MSKSTSDISRRSFFKGAALMTGGIAAAGLAGCSPAGEASEADADDVAQQDAPASEAEPIAPVEVPAEWDMEADVVVVGMGGGGVNACAYAAEQGASVIGIEKDYEIGGASAQAGSIFCILGGTKSQNEIEYGFPSFPVDYREAIAHIQRDFNFSLDDKLLMSWAEQGVEALDWMEEHPESDLQIYYDPEFPDWSYFYTSKEFAAGETLTYMGGMRPVVDGMASVAERNGAQILTSTIAAALVQDGDRVVGVKATQSGEDLFIKANKGVILTAGGFGMNLDMLEKWIPSAFNGAAAGGPMPTHTGEVTRMAQGVGADMAGLNSFACWHGYIDEARNGDRGDGNFWHFFYHGERQLVANPWLTIDRKGDRVPYYFPGANQNLETNTIFDDGGMLTADAYMSRVGGRSYQIFDDDFRTNIFTLVDSYGPMGRLDDNRCPITKGHEIPECTADLVSDDWEAEVQACIDRGGIQVADTLEELAEKMGLDPEVVVSAVDRWNADCEKGEDTELAIQYDPAWLIPVKKAPFYGACVSGGISKTLCGVRVNENMQALDVNGKPIPGLYAGYSTAGGFAGEGNYGGFYNPTIFGSCGASFVSGYIAAKALLAE